MTGTRRISVLSVTGVLTLAGLAGFALLPYLHRPPSSDEGGFLLLASQWARGGPSLYGHYWVDRPPLLIGMFALAAGLGGVVPLRLLGIAATVVSVLLAGGLGALAVPHRRRAAWWSAAVAAVFLAMPLYGSYEVDGEVLAVPFVLVGLVLVLAGCRVRSRLGLATAWLLAGASAAAAALVKQNVLDVAVAAVAVLLLLAHRDGPRHAATRATWFGVGAACSLGGVLAWAATRGTDPAELFDAVVTFRAAAASVISSSSSAATPTRLGAMLLALVASGAPAYLLLCGWHLRRPPRADAERDPTRDRLTPIASGLPPDLRWPAAALVAWDLFAVLAGGSYWLHYLIGLVPGLVLAVVAVLRRPAGTHTGFTRWLAGMLTWSVAVAAMTGVVVASRPAPEQDDETVATYLRTHARPGDTAVVVYGHPDILQEAGLRSPYPYLWSLPVRVRDPHLTELTQVLDGPNRPQWLVVRGESLRSWGIDSRTAQDRLDASYHEVADLVGYDVYQVNPALSRSRTA